MEFTAKQIDDLARVVARVIGDKLSGLSKPQRDILNHQLSRVLRSRNGDVSQVTDEQILGAYEMIDEVGALHLKRIIKSYKGRRVNRSYLASPSCFSHGWG